MLGEVLVELKASFLATSVKTRQVGMTAMDSVEEFHRGCLPALYQGARKIVAVAPEVPGVTRELVGSVFVELGSVDVVVGSDKEREEIYLLGLRSGLLWSLFSNKNLREGLSYPRILAAAYSDNLKVLALQSLSARNSLKSSVVGHQIEGERKGQVQEVEIRSGN